MFVSFLHHTAKPRGQLAGQQQRKEQILRKLDQQLVKNKSAWVETITARVLGRGE